MNPAFQVYFAIANYTDRFPLDKHAASSALVMITEWLDTVWTALSESVTPWATDFVQWLSQPRA